MLFLQTLAFLVLGIFFLIRGLRGRYLGPEPRCRSCTYQLTGRLDAERCPECGTILTPKTLVYGLRKPRWWSMLAVVVVVAVFWAVPGKVVWTLQQVDWYEYYPVGMLLWRAKADQPRAIGELARRACRGELSSKLSYEIAELGLRKLEQWPSGSSAWTWSYSLESMDDEGLLTAQQRDQLFLTFAQPMLTVRPVIRQGDPIVVVLDYQSFGATFHRYYFWHDPARVSVRGYEIFRASGDDWRDRDPDWYRTYAFLACSKTMTFPTGSPPTGTAKLKYLGRHVFLDDEVDRWTETPSWSGEITLTGTVEILPANARDSVAWLVTPDVEGQLRDTIRVHVVRTDRRGHRWFIPQGGMREKVPLQPDGNSETLTISVSFSEPSPVPLAFDLVVEADGVELATDFVVHTSVDIWRQVCPRPMLVWRAEESGPVRGIAIVPRFTADEVFVILRGSRDVARQTIDMYEVWQGELRFGPFRVEHPSP